MSFGHFDVMAQNTDYCEERQNWKSAISLVKIIIIIISKIISCIFLKVWENKVPLEFRFSLQKVVVLVLLGFSPKKSKNGQKCTFLFKKKKNLKALLHNQLLKFIM